VPTGGKVYVPLPSEGPFSYRILNAAVLECGSGTLQGAGDHCFDLGNLPSGLYFIELKNKNGVVYSVKVLKH
jgi:hypothetical protein